MRIYSHTLAPMAPPWLFKSPTSQTIRINKSQDYVTSLSYSKRNLPDEETNLLPFIYAV